jgi:hypothetical protein
MGAATAVANGLRTSREETAPGLASTARVEEAPTMGTAGSRIRRTFAGLLIAVGGGVAALGPVAAESGTPFNARLTGTAAFTSPTSVEFDGTGTATYLGRFTNDGVAVLGPPTDGCPNGMQGIPNVHTETLIAADGDELVIRMIDLACPTSPTSFHGTGQWTVLGGTGRFTDVTGAGSIEGDADFATNTFDLTLTGTLSRP